MRYHYGKNSVSTVDTNLNECWTVRARYGRYKNERSTVVNLQDLVILGMSHDTSKDEQNKRLFYTVCNYHLLIS